MAEIFPETPITSLPDAVALLGALPMPVGTVPQPLALSEEQIDALATAGNRVVNDEVHQHLCMCDAWPEKCVSSGHYFMGAWDVDGLEAALPAMLGLWEQMRGGELAALRSQVAALLEERRTTNEALDDAVQELRARQSCPCPPADQPGPHQVGCPQAEVPRASVAESAPQCRCDEPGADPYACEAEPEDCSGEFSELNPFGGSRPTHAVSAEVSRPCGQCEFRTSLWHVDDGSAEEELHRHVVRVHGGTEDRPLEGDALRRELRGHLFGGGA